MSIHLIEFTNATTKKPVLINPAHVSAVYAEAGDGKNKYTRLLLGDRIVDVTESFSNVSTALVGEVPF
ncbi:MAG: hypothetical protein ACTHKE_04205 [Sphingomicrobium sp.]